MFYFFQIGQEVKRFSRGIRGARSVCVYGGTGISEQIAELKRGAEIIVCTPGMPVVWLENKTWWVWPLYGWQKTCQVWPLYGSEIKTRQVWPLNS